LNTPNSYRASLQPLDIIKALSDHNPGKHNSLFSSREHQDAQELFQLLSECIKNETAAVDKEGYRDRGLGGLSQLEETSREIGKSVFDGLTANRRSCIECGYTEAVMHFAFDNWQLAVPRLVVRIMVIIYVILFLTISCRAAVIWKIVSPTIRDSRSLRIAFAESALCWRRRNDFCRRQNGLQC
jgi:hypothetical protein